jgi:hypothetical protein
MACLLPDVPNVKWKPPRSETAVLAAFDEEDDSAEKIYTHGAKFLNNPASSLHPGLSREQQTIGRWMRDATVHQTKTAFERSTPTNYDRRLFDKLVAQWKGDTSFASSTTDMFRHPAYRAIIGMGQVVVPLLLRELGREPDQWFHALKEITGADPVPIAQRGNLRQMTEAWIRWGRSHGVTR